MEGSKPDSREGAMRSRICIGLSSCFLVGATILVQGRASTPNATKRVAPSSAARTAVGTSRLHVTEKYGQLPLAFEANQGQADAQVKFLSRGSGYTLFL